MKKIDLNSNKDISISISERAMGVLMMAQPHPKGLKRLIRIRANVMREIDALNKELKRHPFNKVIFGTFNKVEVED